MGDQYHSSNQPPDDDFRWLIDLDSHHQPPLDFMSKPEFYARLKSNVGDAIFFTEHKSHGNAVLQENGQPVNTPSPVGQVIGFRSQKEGSELRIDNGQNLLLNSQGKYTVIIRYHCTTGAAGSNPVNSDFSRIYDVIHDDGNLPRYDLVYDDYETPWISGCEMAKMTGHSQNIASIFTQNTSLSLAQMEEIAENLNYINRRLTCDVICQSVVFGKYSRTVS